MSPKPRSTTRSETRVQGGWCLVSNVMTTMRPKVDTRIGQTHGTMAKAPIAQILPLGCSIGLRHGAKVRSRHNFKESAFKYTTHGSGPTSLPPFKLQFSRAFIVRHVPSDHAIHEDRVKATGERRPLFIGFESRACQPICQKLFLFPNTGI